MFTNARMVESELSIRQHFQVSQKGCRVFYQAEGAKSYISKLQTVSKPNVTPESDETVLTLRVLCLEVILPGVSFNVYCLSLGGFREAR